MKLFVSYYNNKFIRNIVLSKINNLEVLSGQYVGNLYKIQQKYLINSYIFSIEDLNNHEVLQFINDYSNKLKIFLYHSEFNNNIVSTLSKCTHLVNRLDSTSNTENVILIPNLVNSSIFSNVKTEKSELDSIICFMDDVKIIPEKLYNILYPKSKIKIKMYGATFKHHQNLGSVSEQDKKYLLDKYQSYLDINGDYFREAAICSCDVYTIDSLLNKTAINKDIVMDHISYEQFLLSILV